MGFLFCILIYGITFTLLAEGVIHTFNLNVGVYKHREEYVVRKGIIFPRYLSVSGGSWWGATKMRQYCMFSSGKNAQDASYDVSHPLLRKP